MWNRPLNPLPSVTPIINRQSCKHPGARLEFHCFQPNKLELELCRLKYSFFVCQQFYTMLIKNRPDTATLFPGSSLAPGDGKMREPGNEVADT